MKYKNITLWVLITVALTSLLADESISIDQQIAAMQKATPQERVKLMNQFKQQLATMNAQERAQSITQLQKQMKAQNNQNNQHLQGEQMQSEAQHQQMQQSEQMQRMEQMQQRHSGDQYQKELDQEMGSMGGKGPNPPQKRY